MDPQERPNADVLLEHPFIKKSQGKKLLAELVANSIDQIEAFREAKAKASRYPKEDLAAEFGPGKQIKIVEDGNYEYNESGTTKVYMDSLDNEENEDEHENPEKYITNESGTMIVKKTPHNSAAKNITNLDEENDIGSGSIVYHRVKNEPGEAESEYEVYIKIYREYNRKYEKDKNEMESELTEICKYLTYNQRKSPMDIFHQRKTELQTELDAELEKIKQKYMERICDIDKIIQYKRQLEVIRARFKEIGTNIEDLDCMKDIGEKKSYFKKQHTIDNFEQNPTNIKETKESKEVPQGNPINSTQQILKKYYKIGEKGKVTLNINTGDAEGSKPKPLATKDKEKPNLSSRGALPKNPGSPSAQTPKSGLAPDKKNNQSVKNLLQKKPLVSILAEKNKYSESSSDKIGLKKKV